MSWGVRHLRAVRPVTPVDRFQRGLAPVVLDVVVAAQQLQAAVDRLLELCRALPLPREGE